MTAVHVGEQRICSAAIRNNAYKTDCGAAAEAEREVCSEERKEMVPSRTKQLVIIPWVW